VTHEQALAALRALELDPSTVRRVTITPQVVIVSQVVDGQRQTHSYDIGRTR
jgi:hypothetical protein